MTKHSQRRCIARNTFVIMTVAVFQFSAISLGYGRPFRLSKIPDKGKHFGCATCHIDPKGGGHLNPFGVDFRKHGVTANDKYTEELGALDSDGDGFNNDGEFASKTNPGDHNSTPAKK